MSLYEENIGFLHLVRRPFRVLSNIYHVFVAKEICGKPFGIKFEVSSICNLRCIMCPLSKGLKRKQGLLKFDNFKKIYDEIKPPYINLTGIGEPLLNPDLFKIIDYARKKGSLVKLDTNATLLNNENIKKLLEVNPNIISTSIDSVNKESFEKIRKGANFEEVIKNLKNLILYRNKLRSKARIHVNFVFQKENYKDLIDFITYMDSIGVDSINGDIALSLGQHNNIENRKINTENIAKLKERLKNLKIKASLNIEHIIEFLKYGNDLLQRKMNCFYAWYYPSITWDGYLVPCCYICDNEIVFGNVLEEPFMKVWNNDKIREFRKNILVKRNGVCAKCFINETYIYEKLKLVSKIPVLNKFTNRNF